MASSSSSSSDDPPVARGWSNGVPVTYPTASSPPVPRTEVPRPVVGRQPLASALAGLPPSVSRPGTSAVSFPKAFDPDRALLYQRAMSRAMPKKTWASKGVTLAVWLSCSLFAYRILLVEDFGHNNVIFADYRKERLRRLQLRRPLTASEQAQWDRPWPEPTESFAEWITHAREKHRRRKAALMEKREAYLAAQQQQQQQASTPAAAATAAAAAAAIAGDASSSSSSSSSSTSSETTRTVDWRRWESQEASRLASAEAVEPLPADLDWGRIGLLGQLATTTEGSAALAGGAGRDGGGPRI